MNLNWSHWFNQSTKGAHLDYNLLMSKTIGLWIPLWCACLAISHIQYLKNSNILNAALCTVWSLLKLNKTVRYLLNMPLFLSEWQGEHMYNKNKIILRDLNQMTGQKKTRKTWIKIENWKSCDGTEHSELESVGSVLEQRRVKGESVISSPEWKSAAGPGWCWFV